MNKQYVETYLETSREACLKMAKMWGKLANEDTRPFEQLLNDMRGAFYEALEVKEPAQSR